MVAGGGRFILSGDGCWWVTLDIVSCGGYVWVAMSGGGCGSGSSG